ncbi:PKD domain-containing protein [Dinghuibacter silviterrae]|uniref:Gliding motility-associated-like protein n=1 Tax=Dinghuibacter silviterrae TaxID=1539049 RepID=A0A4R8DQI0_9BACT|nr:PKD domain-containing protein [Dinghuibacter silviterrae]TDX00410.1 gliding motility-associated-like protein [Dinghuibacter silviterrae]
MLLQAVLQPAKGQVQAAFSASPVSGCTPLFVQFTDQSAGNPVSWKWDLGNGNRSGIQNPAATYFSPGTYTVKLVVTDASGHVDSVTKTQYISVYPIPVAAFGVTDTTGCLPLATAFADSSTTTPGSIVQWKWDFGDGTTASTADPQHTYTAAGRFNVSLQVTSNYGCAATLTRLNLVDIPAPAQAAFSANPVAACKTPDTVRFANTSTGPGPLTYTWAFGDQGVSTVPNPMHIYTQPGTYTVSLIATSPMGCADTLTQTAYIAVGQGNASFTTSVPTGCTKSPVTFRNTTGVHPDSVLWRFGDGQVSRLPGPAHTYTLAGSYAVTLVVYAGACTDSVTQTFPVTNPPKGNFTASRTTGCSLPLSVQFQADSSGILTYAWTFGDGGTSTLQNPVHTYTSFGSFTVRLIVTGPGGCPDTVQANAYINISPPSAIFKGLPVFGCVPYTITPTAQITSPDPVVQYLWDFGDGSQSAVAAPSHTYTVQGTYTISLTMTTSGGCTATQQDTAAVTVGTKPATAFTGSPTSACVGQAILFTGTTPGPVSNWNWYPTGLGGDVYGGTPNYYWAYGDTGTYTVALVNVNNGCRDTVVHQLYIHIAPPAAHFTTAMNCSQRLTRSFTDVSVDETARLWKFGDGDTSTEPNPVHTYATPGTYWVSLTVTNGTCTETGSQKILVIMEDPTIQASVSSTCRRSMVTFTCPHLDTSMVSGITWDFGDGVLQSSRNNPAITHVYLLSGQYHVTVRVTDLNHCDTTYTLPVPVSVNGPTAAFTPAPTAVCAGVPVTFNDHSTTDGTHPLAGWTWSFGDGVRDSLLTPPYLHTYTKGGSMLVVLTVRDTYGCTDSTVGNVLVSAPRVDFSVSDTVICAGKTIYFDNRSTGGMAPITYTWNFGDGITASASNPGFAPSHVYTRPGLDTVSLRLTDALGCSDSLSKPGYVHVQVPTAAFTLPQKISSCPPLQAQFTNQSSSFTGSQWDFGDGNTSTGNNPVHFYSYPGVYVVTLTVTGASGCTSVANDTVIVHGPTGTFTYSPVTGCDSVSARFAVASDSSVNFVWDYGDGETLSGPQNMASHAYLDTGTYQPRIILVNADHCQVPITGAQLIHVYKAVAGLGMNATKACGSALIQFEDSSLSNDAPGAYFWDFGDGSTSSAQNPSHAYNQPGAYSVTHAFTTINGCTDTLRLPDTIHIFQPPEVQVHGDSSACMPATLSFYADVLAGASLSWQWNLGDGQTAKTPQPPPAAYTQAGNYTVSLQVVDNHGCTDSSGVNVVIHPLPATSAGGNYVLCQGTPIALQASGADRYVWSPPAGLSCTTCATPQADPPSDIEYYLTGYTVYGCTTADSAHIRVIHPPVVLVGGDTAVCLGGYYRLQASGAYTYRWSPSTGLTNPDIADPVATPPATTTYTVAGSDSAHCFTELGHITVTVDPLPTVSVGPDVTAAAGTPTPLHTTNSPDVTGWVWAPPGGLSCDTCPDPSASPTGNTFYTVTVRNAAGCTAQDTLTVFVTCGGGNVFIPNTFSPNGDGMNDVFYPRGKGISLVKSFRIFNRWGQLVFERYNFLPNDVSAGWDGTVGGRKVSPDVFVYECEIICENNQALLFKGDVTLLR